MFGLISTSTSTPRNGKGAPAASISSLVLDSLSIDSLAQHTCPHKNVSGACDWDASVHRKRQKKSPNTMSERRFSSENLRRIVNKPNDVAR